MRYIKAYESVEIQKGGLLTLDKSDFATVKKSTVAIEELFKMFGYDAVVGIYSDNYRGRTYNITINDIENILVVEVNTHGIVIKEINIAFSYLDISFTRPSKYSVLKNKIVSILEKTIEETIIKRRNDNIYDIILNKLNIFSHDKYHFNYNEMHFIFKREDTYNVFNLFFREMSPQMIVSISYDRLDDVITFGTPVSCSNFEPYIYSGEDMSDIREKLNKFINTMDKLEIVLKEIENKLNN